MAYAGGAGGDIGSLRFLAANVLYQATGGLLAPDSGDDADRGILDDAVMLLDVISSYHTQEDAKFLAEMEDIRVDRKAAMKAVPNGQELAPEAMERFRWRELKAMFRSLCRAGTFVRVDSPGSSWKPELKAVQ